MPNAKVGLEKINLSGFKSSSICFAFKYFTIHPTYSSLS